MLENLCRSGEHTFPSSKFVNSYPLSKVGLGWLWPIQIQTSSLPEKHNTKVEGKTCNFLKSYLSSFRDVQRRRIFKQHHRERELTRSIYLNDLLPKVDTIFNQMLQKGQCDIEPYQLYSAGAARESTRKSGLGDSSRCRQNQTQLQVREVVIPGI